MTNKYIKNNVGKKNRIFSLIICIAFSLLFIIISQTLPMHSAITIALASSSPSIYFSEDSWDFGEITSDELPVHIFKFKNIGDEVLIIKGTKVSCESCVDPLISTDKLNPGEEGELKITVNSLEMIGRFTKRIYLESNDQVNPQVVITVSGFIKEKNERVTKNSVKQYSEWWLLLVDYIVPASMRSNLDNILTINKMVFNKVILIDMNGRERLSN